MDIKILLVDDDEDLRYIYRKFFEKHGYEIALASDGMEALERIKRDHYPIVLTDIMMPDIDGIELLKKIKGLDKETYVIMVTAYADTDNAIKSLKYGANDFIKKSEDMTEILEAVEKGVETLEEEEKYRETSQTITLNPSVMETFEDASNESMKEFAGALKKIIDMDVKVYIKETGMDEVENFAHFVGGEGIRMVGTFAGLYDHLSGNVIFVLPTEDATSLGEILSGEDTLDIYEEGKYFINEAGSIISETIVRNLRAMSGVDMKITPVSFVNFNAGNFRSFLDLRTGRRKQYYITHILNFDIVIDPHKPRPKKILGYFMFVFDLRNLGILNNIFS